MGDCHHYHHTASSSASKNRQATPPGGAHPCDHFHKDPCLFGPKCYLFNYPANACCNALKDRPCKKKDCKADHDPARIFHCAHCGVSVDHQDGVAKERFERYHRCQGKEEEAKLTHPCLAHYAHGFEALEAKGSSAPNIRTRCWNEDRCFFKNYPRNACLARVKNGHCDIKRCPAEHDISKIYRCVWCDDSFSDIFPLELAHEILAEHECPMKPPAEKERFDALHSSKK